MYPVWNDNNKSLLRVFGLGPQLVEAGGHQKGAPDESRVNVNLPECYVEQVRMISQAGEIIGQGCCLT